jgi:hypothetical protein
LDNIDLYKNQEINEYEYKMRAEIALEEAAKIESYNFADSKAVATHMGIPYERLEILMHEHHERDQVVRQSLHENVAFIKMSEGYPQFLYKNASKKVELRMSH